MVDLMRVQRSSDFANETRADGEEAVTLCGSHALPRRFAIESEGAAIMSEGDPCSLVDANAFYAQLNQFTGSSEFYPHWLKGFVYTKASTFLRSAPVATGSSISSPFFRCAL